MEVINVQIDHHEGYANSPTFDVYVDKLPSRDELIYAECLIKHSTLYLAITKDGYASYMLHNPSNESGFGGSKFTFKVLNSDEPRVIRGPWSSRAGIVNKFFTTQIVDVTYILPNGEKRSGALALDVLKKFSGVKVSEEYGDIRYDPVI